MLKLRKIRYINQRYAQPQSYSFNTAFSFLFIHKEDKIINILRTYIINLKKETYSSPFTFIPIFNFPFPFSNKYSNLSPFLHPFLLPLLQSLEFKTLKRNSSTENDHPNSKHGSRLLFTSFIHIHAQRGNPFSSAVEIKIYDRAKHDYRAVTK